MATRNFICPATDTRCSDPDCKRDLCREIQRQDIAFVQRRAVRGEIASVASARPRHDHWQTRQKKLPFGKQLAIVLGIYAVILLLGFIILSRHAGGPVVPFVRHY